MICFDCDFDIRPMIPCLLAKGDPEIVVGRYICSDFHNWKATNVREMVAIAEANAQMQAKDASAFFKVWLIFEDNGKPRGAATGAANAKVTRQWISMLNVPVGGLIAYTDDEDGPVDSVLAATKAYFEGLQYQNGKSLVTRGLYGSGQVLTAAKNAGLIDVRWPTMSMGFTGSRKMIANGDYEMRQLLDVHFCGHDVDPDVFRDGVTPDQCGCFTPDPHPVIV